MHNRTLSQRRIVICALLPQIAIIIGVLLFRNAFLALGLEFFLILTTLFLAHRTGWRPRSFRIHRNRQLYFLIPIHLLAGPVLFWIIGTDIELVRQTVDSLNVGSDAWLFLLLIHGCAIPIIEEIFWRDLLYDHSTKPVIQDILFACYHAGLLYLLLETPLLVISLMVLTATAWLWRHLVGITNSIGIVILLHAAADLSIMSIAWIVGVV